MFLYGGKFEDIKVEETVEDAETGEDGDKDLVDIHVYKK